jgi:hypothetical protein
VRARVVHAIERGEVHSHVDPERLIEVINGATHLSMLPHAWRTAR